MIINEMADLVFSCAWYVAKIFVLVDLTFNMWQPISVYDEL